MKIVSRCFLAINIAFAFVLFCAGSGTAKEPISTLEGTITAVSDGDTVKLETADGTRLRIRLYGIDAPETEKINRRTGRISKPGQPYGEESKKALEKMIYGERVRVDIIDVDRYRRMVSIIWLSGKNVNLEMLKLGMAEAYRQYLREPYRLQFIEAERKAKDVRLGIWSLGNQYESPSVFRKRLRFKGD